MPMRAVRTMDRMMSEMPFEVLIVFLCILSGTPMAFGAVPSPNSLLVSLPHWAVRGWGALLAVGGLMTYIGLVMSHIVAKRRFIEGLYVEAGGLLLIGSGSLVFSMSIMAVNGWNSIFSISVYIVLAASCFFRYRTLRRTIRKMREAIELERKLHGSD